MNDLQVLCRQIRDRSRENREAIRLLHGASLHGQAVGALRQELDSMVRVIYLLSIQDRHRRADLVNAAANGRIWKALSSGRITDREMVELAWDSEYERGGRVKEAASGSGKRMALQQRAIVRGLAPGGTGLDKLISATSEALLCGLQAANVVS